MTKSSHKIRIHAAPDKVYHALTSKEGLKGWFTPQVEGEVAEGNEVNMHFKGKESFRWKLTEFKPETRVHWDCLEGPGSAAGTTVTYVLSGQSGETVLECDHDGWPSGHEAFETCNTLWGILMGRLKALCETGKADPAFS